MKKIIFILLVIGVIVLPVIISSKVNKTTDKVTHSLTPSPTKKTQIYRLETPSVGKIQPYKIIEKEIYADFTEESWQELVKYVKTTNKIVSDSNVPIKSIKIYFKNDGITIDIEKMKQTYSIKDIEPILSTLKEKSETVVKGESIDIVIHGDVSKDDIKATITSIIQEEIVKDNDLDKIFVVAWRNEADVEDGYTLAYTVWGPEDDITEKIAKENIRDGYFINWIRIDK